MAEFDPVFEGAHLRASLHPGTKPQLIVTFDYRRTGRDGFAPANHSSGFARQGFGQLSISSRANDWFINPDTVSLETALPAIAARYDRVHALGYSMGGYGTLRFARALGLHRAVLVSPQSSIAPSAVPFEWRYKEEAAGFDPVLGDLATRVQAGLHGVLLVDPFVRADILHAHLIQRLYPAIRILRLNFGGHPAIRVLRAAGKPWLVQREAALERANDKWRARAGDEIREAHREGRRASAGYWERLAKRAGLRHPRLAGHATAIAAGLPRVTGDAAGDAGDDRPGS